MRAAVNFEWAESAPGQQLRPRFRRLTDISDLNEAKSEWDRLFAHADDARLGFQAQGWAHRYALAGALNVVTIRDHERLVLVWPLVSRRLPGAIVLEALGDPISQYHTALVDPMAPAEVLLEVAIGDLRRAGCDLLRLRRVRADTPLAGALLAQGAETLRAGRAPFVDLVAGKLAQGGSAKGNARANRRRRLRRLEEIGPVRFEVVASPKVAEGLLRTALILKRAWAIKTGHFARAAFDPRFEAVFRQALTQRDPFVKLRVSSLKCGERVVGVEVSLACGRRLFGHLPHDPELSALGVGALLAESSILSAREQGYETYDLLAPADAYKRAFADGEIDVLDLQLPLTRSGRLLGKALTTCDKATRWLAPRAPLAIRRAALLRIGR